MSGSSGRTASEARARAFTLVEAVISTVIVSVAMVAALTSVSRSSLFRRIANERQIGFQLGQQLMAEILSKDYLDPAYPGGGSMGPGGDETATGNRSLYDDVDDYNGWLECPPRLADGTVIANRTQWYRKVNVAWVRPTSPDVPVGYETWLKRITVEVGTVVAGGSVSFSRNRQPKATLVALAGQGR
ncbi:MAG: prepilin-type N-terminal cleavage/methylation domain-containing protein [Planctomycetes bacterium]|nr:prepilin-type N-terminal cleavage/methylation domain-containing protein [Planctomycetota bacterium]